jgi:hypothetical protein
MAPNMKDPAGESVSATVREAAEEGVLPVRRDGSPSLAAELLEIGKRCASLPDLKIKSAEEILEYDHNGIPL